MSIERDIFSRKYFFFNFFWLFIFFSTVKACTSSTTKLSILKRHKFDVFEGWISIFHFKTLFPRNGTNSNTPKCYSFIIKINSAKNFYKRSFENIRSELSLGRMKQWKTLCRRNLEKDFLNAQNWRVLHFCLFVKIGVCKLLAN